MAPFVPLGQSPCISPKRPLATISHTGFMPRTGSFDDLALGERQHDLESRHLGAARLGSQDSISSSSIRLSQCNSLAPDASAGDANASSSLHRVDEAKAQETRRLRAPLAPMRRRVPPRVGSNDDPLQHGAVLGGSRISAVLASDAATAAAAATAPPLPAPQQP